MTECPLPLPHHERIVLGHGSGGRLTTELIGRVFYPAFGNPTLLAGDDAAVLSGPDSALDGCRLAVTTDAHVVRPLFFPGGDIGRLAVLGTVNDLAMVGARPRWIAAAFVLEEGLPTGDLVRIVTSVRGAAAETGVSVVAGDTKVVERGKADGLYIVTTGVGTIPEGRETRASNLVPGDAVLVSGPLGDHGIAVLAARGDLALASPVISDLASLLPLVEALYASGVRVHALRDLTRGGLAAALNELATRSGVAVRLEEAAIPVRPEVEAACEVLGFDPLQVANEGTLAAFVPEDDAERALAAMGETLLGTGARRVGTVLPGPSGRVLLETVIGGVRIVDVPAGELLPRIC